MSDPAARHLVVPVSSNLADGRATVGMETGSGVRQVRRNPLEQDFDERDDTLSMQLVVGRLPTKITSGDYAPDGRLVAGTVDDLVTVVRKVDDQQGTVARGADPESGPNGVAALRGSALVHTREGLARLDGLLTSGGFPVSEYSPDGQAGKVPCGVHTLGRFAWWFGDAQGTKGISAPLRFLGLGTPIFPDPGMTFVEPIGGDRVRLWGSLSPIDLRTGRFADLEALYRADPEGYQDRIRWTPVVDVPLEELLGDDEPPPPENPPPFQPPRGPLADPDLLNPVTRKPLGGGKPKHPDDEEDEEDPPKEEIIDGRQRRLPFDPEEPTGFVPGADTFIPGTGLPNPGSTITGEAGTEGKTIVWCPLADPAEDDPGIGWVPSPTGTTGGAAGAGVGVVPGGGEVGTTGGSGTTQADVGAGAALVGGLVAGGLVAGLPSGPGAAGGALTPGQRAALVLEDGSKVKLRADVPTVDELTDAQKAALVDLVQPRGIARVPSPTSELGQKLSVRGWGALVARQLNAITEMVQAALVGGRYSYYAGNLGIVNTNQRGLGIADQFIGQHLVDPDDTKVIPPAIHHWQAVEGKSTSVQVTTPVQRVERILIGDVTATGPVLGLKKSTGQGATDTGAWIAAESGEFEVQDDGRGYFAGGVSGDHYHVRDYYTEQNVDNVVIPTAGVALAVLDDKGEELNHARLVRRGSTTSLVVDGGSGTSEIRADKVTCDVLDPYAVVFEPYEFPFTPPVFSSIAPGLWSTNDTMDPAGGPPFDPYWFNGVESKRVAYADELPSGSTPTQSYRTLHVDTTGGTGTTGASYTLPANTLANDNESLEIEASGSGDGVSADQVVLTFGGTTLLSVAIGGGGAWWLRGTLTRTGASSQEFSGVLIGSSIGRVNAAASAIGLSSNAALKVAYAVNDTDDSVDLLRVAWRAAPS